MNNNLSHLKLIEISSILEHVFIPSAKILAVFLHRLFALGKCWVVHHGCKQVTR